LDGVEGVGEEEGGEDVGEEVVDEMTRGLEVDEEVMRKRTEHRFDFRDDEHLWFGEGRAEVVKVDRVRDCEEGDEGAGVLGEMVDGRTDSLDGCLDHSCRLGRV